MMNGSLSVESHPGEGSTFRIDLPLECRPITAATADTLAESHKILVLSDSPRVREILQRQLAAWGLQSIPNGLEALASGKIAKNAAGADCIIFDEGPSSAHATASLNKLRDLPGLHRLPMVCQHSTAGNRTTAFDANHAQLDVVKPVRAEELRKALLNATEPLTQTEDAAARPVPAETPISA